MRHLKSAVLVVLLTYPILPAVAQQADNTPATSQPQPQAQTTPVQPELTPQQTEQARKQEIGRDDSPRLNQNWTTRQRDDVRPDGDRMPQRRMLERDDDRRTVGRAWSRDEDDGDRGYQYDGRGRGHGYGAMERREGRYYDEDRLRSRVKTCIEYANGEEFCRYRN